MIHKVMDQKMPMKRRAMLIWTILKNYVNHNDYNHINTNFLLTKIDILH